MRKKLIYINLSLIALISLCGVNSTYGEESGVDDNAIRAPAADAVEDEAYTAEPAADDNAPSLVTSKPVTPAKRTVEQMEADEAAHPAAAAPAEIPFRPTMDPSLYKSQKEAAGKASQGRNPQAPRSPPRP